MQNKNSHIFFQADNMRLLLLDQRQLPEHEKFVVCDNCQQVTAAIRNMTVRGAPAIGVTAAYGCVLALASLRGKKNWQYELRGMLDELVNARPTAVNLEWAVKRMLEKFDWNGTPEALLPAWIDKAIALHNEDVSICKAIGEKGSTLIKNGDVILTHCNAGALATGGYGTALGVVRAACEAGKKISVVADETRPFFQGSRLTAWELDKEGIPVTIVCDNGAPNLLQHKRINCVITGADRIAGNGDTANKIGTLGLAIAAKYFNVPFYVAAPVSTIDFALPSGEKIKIEERDSAEVTQIGDVMLAPHGVTAINYAFDVTPAKLISAIVTEQGVLYPPYENAIANLKH